MASSSNHIILHLLLLSLTLALLLPSISCNNDGGDDDDLVVYLCEKVVHKNQPNPTFADKMLSELIQWAPRNGFAYNYQLITGLYGLAWCRGDFSDTRCSTCLANATKKLVDLCSHETIAARLVYQDFCYLRIGIENFIENLDTYFGRILYDDSTDQEIAEAHREAYWASVEGLLSDLKQAIPHREKRFGRMDVNFDAESLKIYAMGQCLQGSDKELCKSCLDHTMEYLMAHCLYGKYCEVFYGSCFLKYYTKAI